MNSRKVKGGAALLMGAVVALALSACSGGAAAGGGSSTSASNCSQSATTGVTDSTIKIGTSLPESGALSFFGGVATAEKAYYDSVNAMGGVKSADGKTRKIEFTALDDAYDPAKAKTNASELVNGDKVFALVGAFGTSEALAARPVIEAACAPDVLLGSTNAAIQDIKHPLQTGAVGIGTGAEGTVFAQYLLKDKPTARVAIISQSGDYGTPFVSNFTSALKGSTVKIVGSQSFDPTATDVRSQVTTLAATKANVFFIVATSTVTEQALNDAHAINWEPTSLVPSGNVLYTSDMKTLNSGAANGAIVGNTVKDVSDTSDPAVAAYLKAFAAEPGASKFSPQTEVGGYVWAEAAVSAIASLKTVNRPNFVAAMHKLTIVGDSSTLLQDGLTYKLTPASDDGLLAESLRKWDASTKTFSPVGVFSATGN